MKNLKLCISTLLVSLFFSFNSFAATFVFEGQEYEVDEQILNQSLINAGYSSADDIEHIEVEGTKLSLTLNYAYNVGGITNEDWWGHDQRTQRTRSGSYYSERERDEMKNRCLMKGEIAFNQCVGLVGAGATVGTAASTACGPLLAACLLVVALETTAGGYVCADAHTKHKYACTRL